jgi:hypothetical protein
MSSEVTGGWFLRGFDVETDALRTEVELRGFSRHALREIVSLPPSDPGVNSYRVDPNQIPKMKLWLPHPLEPLPNLEWFVEFNTYPAGESAFQP